MTVELIPFSASRPECSVAQRLHRIADQVAGNAEARRDARQRVDAEPSGGFDLAARPARRVRDHQAVRLGQFVLKLHPDKTRQIEFGRFAR